MSITKELERIHGDRIDDIADGAGYYAGTNPPRKLNIAEAISGGLTTNIAKACDIFYGNEPVSQTISEAIAKGVDSGSPYRSIADIMKAVEEGGGQTEIEVLRANISRSIDAPDYWPVEGIPDDFLPYDPVLEQIHVNFDGVDYYPELSLSALNPGTYGYCTWSQNEPYPVYTDYPFAILGYDHRWVVTVKTGVVSHSIVVSYNAN